MLAPPPEGSFEIDNESVPLKSTPMSDATPEQAPLLAKEEGVTSTAQNKKREVRLTYFCPPGKVWQPCT